MNVLEKLNALSTAAGAATKTVDITIGDVTQTFTLRRLSFEEAQTISTHLFAPDENGEMKFDKGKMPERNARLICICVVNDDGTEALTLAQAKALHPKVGAQLLTAANEFNGFNEKAVEKIAKNSLPTDSAAT